MVIIRMWIIHTYGAQLNHAANGGWYWKVTCQVLNQVTSDHSISVCHFVAKIRPLNSPQKEKASLHSTNNHPRRLLCHPRSSASLNISDLIQPFWPHEDSVQFADGTSQMEAPVTSQVDRFVRRPVHLNLSEGIAPMCCGCASIGDAFLCIHGVAVLCEKHRESNVHR